MSLRKQILKEIKNLLREDIDKGIALGAGVGAGLGAAQATGAALATGAAGVAGAGVGTAGATIFLGAAAPAAVLAIGTQIKTALNQYSEKDPVAKQIINQIQTSFTTAYQIGESIAKIIKMTNVGANVADAIGQGMFKIMANMAQGTPEQCLAFVTGYYSVLSPADSAIIKRVGKLPSSFQECKQLGFTQCRDRASTGATFGTGRGGILVPRRDLTVINWFGERAKAATEMYTIWNKAAEVKPPETSPTPPPEPQKEPEPRYKAEQGKCKPPFVGLNGGVTSGPKVTEVQELLVKIGFLRSGYVGGTVDTPTNNAIFAVQRRLSPLGAKIATKLGGTYSGTPITPDGCYGPKTSCAVSLYYGFPDVYNRSKQRCLDILKIKLRDVKREQEFTGPVQFESKNWLDKTREETTSNLFERLVKDASKKVL